VAWAVFVVAVLFLASIESKGVEIPESTATVQTIPEREVEAVPMEYDPVRDDVPLDADLQRLLYQACVETGIRYELALAVIWQETGFRNVVGDGGESFGFMQVQPRWHGERMERLGVTDLSDPYGNFLVGLDFLAELLEKHELTDALTRYNSGKTGNSQYARNVLNYMEILTMEDF
jgi:soluble lytic murein transglycosylase-like protein